MSNDLLWLLHSFAHQSTASSPHSHFLEFSMQTYWRQLDRVLQQFGWDVAGAGLPAEPAAASQLIRQGFTFEFLKNALVRPVLRIRSHSAVLHTTHSANINV